MRQFRYWFGFGILCVALIAVVKVKEKLESFLDSARQTSQFDFRYLGYLNYLNFVAIELEPGVDEAAPLSMLALALASNEISLPELIQKINLEVQKECEGKLSCNKAWADALASYNLQWKAKNIEIPNADELELQLEKDLKEQIFLLMPQGIRPPFQFRLSEPALNQSIPDVNISDEQKNLLRYYDKDASDFTIQPEFTVLKNFADPLNIEASDCSPDPLSGSNNAVRITPDDTKQNLLKRLRNRDGQGTNLWGRLELFHNLEFFQDALEKFPDLTLYVEMVGSLEWLHFNFLKMNHQKLRELHSNYEVRVKFVLNSDPDCSPVKIQSFQRLIGKYVKGVDESSLPLTRAKGYDELSELTLFLY